MKSLLSSVVLLALTMIGMIGCGRNEPGTMGGEPGIPETVATGAPAESAKETSITDPDQPALKSEHASSTFDDPATTNGKIATLPDASTRAPQ